MPRKPPTEKPELTLDSAKATARQRRKDGWIELITQVREYELITPLMGGGVEARKNDPVTIVRGAELRGQLRFWWRACRASRFSSLEEVKQREDEIWGSTETPSEVSIIVESTRGTEEVAFSVDKHPKKAGKLEIKSSDKIAPYAAFPLLPDKDEQKKLGWKSENLAIGVKFTLTVHYPKDFADDVAAALWAWETFGGIGARTRRGFGAIRLLKEDGKSVDPFVEDRSQIEKGLRDNLRKYADGSHHHPEIPQLNSRLKMEFTSVKGSEIKAWKDLINVLREFRQSRYGSAFGQSKWPEANALRLRTGNKVRFSEDVPGEFQKVIDKFPRAAFGLPLLFHLPHDKSIGEVTLQGADGPNGEKRERLASPIILRPLGCKNGKGIGMAVVLDTRLTPPNGLWLKGKAKNTPVPSAELEEDRAKGINEAADIEPLNGVRDVLQAFLNRVKNS
jgi:CRISPR-associated protein Cmr1